MKLCGLCVFEERGTRLRLDDCSASVSAVRRRMCCCRPLHHRRHCHHRLPHCGPSVTCCKIRRRHHHLLVGPSCASYRRIPACRRRLDPCLANLRCPYGHRRSCCRRRPSTAGPGLRRAASSPRCSTSGRRASRPGTRCSAK